MGGGRERDHSMNEKRGEQENYNMEGGDRVKGDVVGG